MVSELFAGRDYSKIKLDKQGSDEDEDENVKVSTAYAIIVV